MPVDVGPGLAHYLSEAWGQEVTVGNLSQSTAGARRHNVLFEADGRRHDPPPRRHDRPVRRDDHQRRRRRGRRPRRRRDSTGSPCPTSTSPATDGDLVGGPFMISEFVPGETVPRRVLRLVEEQGNGETVVRQLGESLARLHSIDPSAVDRAAADPGVLRAAGRRRPRRAAGPVDELPLRRPALELGLQWLERRPPDPPPRETIVHSDTRNGNLIVGEDGLRAVLDWEGTLASGDPMQDLAWPSLRMWRFRNDDREIGGFAGRERVHRGLRRRPAARTTPARFHWWKVEGTLRWGVGLAGQTMGFLEGRVPEHRDGRQRPPGPRARVGPPDAHPAVTLRAARTHCAPRSALTSRRRSAHARARRRPGPTSGWSRGSAGTSRRGRSAAGSRCTPGPRRRSRAARRSITAWYARRLSVVNTPLTSSSKMIRSTTSKSSWSGMTHSMPAAPNAAG